MRSRVVETRCLACVDHTRLLVICSCSNHSNICGHRTLKAPHPVRSAKLSKVSPSQYCGGGPRGNPRCCSSLFSSSSLPPSPHTFAPRHKLSYNVNGLDMKDIDYEYTKDTWYACIMSRKIRTKEESVCGYTRCSTSSNSSLFSSGHCYLWFRLDAVLRLPRSVPVGNQHPRVKL